MSSPNSPINSAYTVHIYKNIKHSNILNLKSTRHVHNLQQIQQSDYVNKITEHVTSSEITKANIYGKSQTWNHIHVLLSISV